MTMFGIAGFIAGILLALVGFFLVFLFPGADEHQPAEFARMGIIMGLICFLAAGILIFIN